MAKLGSKGSEALFLASNDARAVVRVMAAYGLVRCPNNPDMMNRAMLLAVDPAPVNNMNSKTAGVCVQDILDSSREAYERAVAVLKANERPYLVAALRRVRGTNDRTILQLLINYLPDPDQTIRTIALHNLELITQQHFGLDIKKWEDWEAAQPNH